MAGLPELKTLCGIAATDRSCDLYLNLYLTDKKNNVQEAFKKLQRRQMFEHMFTKFPVTEVMVRELKSGKINIIGWDYKSRPVLLVTTALNHPKKETREDEQKNFILTMEYMQTFFRGDVHECVIVVDRHGASLWGNTDLNFERDMATMLTKYYPQQIALILFVNQHWSVNRAVQPYLSLAPNSLKSKILCVNQSELWKHVNVDVLPMSLGGRNTLRDHPADEFGDRVLRHWYALVEKIHRGERTWVRPMDLKGAAASQGRDATPGAPRPSVTGGGSLLPNLVSINGGAEQTRALLEDPDDGMRTPLGPTDITTPKGFPRSPVAALAMPASDSDDEKTQDFSEAEGSSIAHGGVTPFGGRMGLGGKDMTTLRAHLQETERKVRQLEDQLHKVSSQGNFVPGTVNGRPQLEGDMANTEMCKALRVFHEQSNVLLNEVIHEYSASSQLSSQYILRQTRQSFGRVIQVRSNGADGILGVDETFPFGGAEFHGVRGRDAAFASNAGKSTGCCQIS